MVIKYNEDNLREYCKGKTLFILARNDKKIPKWVDSINRTIVYLNQELPNINILEVDFENKPNSVKFIAPDDIEYFPAFFYIENGEVENIFFGFGRERSVDFINMCLKK